MTGGARRSVSFSRYRSGRSAMLSARLVPSQPSARSMARRFMSLCDPASASITSATACARSGTAVFTVPSPSSSESGIELFRALLAALNVHRWAVVVLCDQGLVEVGFVDHGADLCRSEMRKRMDCGVGDRPEGVRPDAGRAGERRE